MPNWCTTEITFKRNENCGVESEKAFRDLIQRVRSQFNGDSNYYENGFGPGWLGNYCIHFGIEMPESFKTNTVKYNCRGCIEYCDEESIDDNVLYNEFCITQYDAWSPNVLMWQIIINKHYTMYDEFGNQIPLIYIFYRATEPGCDLYCTNDCEGIYDKYNIDFDISMIPNKMKVCIQEPGNPFIRIDRSAIYKYNMDVYFKQYISSTSESLYPGICFQDQYSDLDYFVNMMNDVFFTKPMEYSKNTTDSELKERINEFNEETGEWINFNSYQFASIEDIDMPREQLKKEVEAIFRKIN